MSAHRRWVTAGVVLVLAAGVAALATLRPWQPARQDAAAPAPAMTVWTDFAARTVTAAATPPDGAPAALELVAPRNGVASGQIVVACEAPLTAVEADDLTGPGGQRLPGSTLRIRALTDRPAVAAELLVDKPQPAVPEAFTIVSDRLTGAAGIQPLLVTAEVGPDAEPGVYTGLVRLSAGAARAEVRVTLTVAEFILPDPADLDIWLALSFSPTQLAYFYQVPHDGPEHWRLIERQLELVGQLGNHILYLPVLWHNNTGSGPQMIVFKQAADGSLTPDFSRLERYLALVARHLGPQRRVVLGVWGRWMHERNTSPRILRDEMTLTGLDAEGRLAPLTIAADYEARPDLWKAVYDGVADRVERTLGVTRDRIVLGNGDDRHPSAEVDAFWRRIAPESPGWHAWTHHYGDPGPRPRLFEIVDAGSGADEPADGASAARGGWGAADGANLFLCTLRDHHRDGVPPAVYFSCPDAAVGAQKRGRSVGLARIGLDYWLKPLPGTVTPQTGYNGGTHTDPQRVDRSRTSAIAAPGPDGPVPMLHFVALREGIQAAQARIVVEKALAAGVGDAAAFERALRTFRNEGSRLTTFYTATDPSALEVAGGWTTGTRALVAAAGAAQQALNLRQAALDSARAGQARRQQP